MTCGKAVVVLIVLGSDAFDYKDVIMVTMEERREGRLMLGTTFYGAKKK